MQTAKITPCPMMPHAPLCVPCNKNTLLARVLPRDKKSIFLNVRSARKRKA